MIVGNIDLDLFKSLGLYKENVLWWQQKGLMYTRSGYGRKVPTQHMIKWCGKWRRVYCCIYSNCGTCYILQGKTWITVD
jgi:hypothetical protein